MIPIIEFLNKIKWDKSLSEEEYSVGYLDRTTNKIIQIRFTDMIIDPNDKFSFKIVDKKGREHNIPFHRIRLVYRKDEVVWNR